MPRRAFTVTELLVVIGVIGVLIAITLPALRGARSSARTTVCLSHLSTTLQDFAAYRQANDDQYPFARAGEDLPMSPPGELPASSINYGQHFNLTTIWTGLMHGVAPWRQHFETWLCPGARRDASFTPWGSGASSYGYTDPFYARPQVWYPDAEANEELLRPVRATDVRHPSKKVLLYDSEMAHLGPGASEAQRDARPMAFPDGHAAIHALSEAAEPVENPFDGFANRLHDTPRGAHGHDY